MATIFCEISTVNLSYVVTVKSTVEISQNFVPFLRFPIWTLSQQNPTAKSFGKPYAERDETFILPKTRQNLYVLEDLNGWYFQVNSKVIESIMLECEIYPLASS